ncbi:MAG: arylsulfatase, partial [Polaribacter sp.]
IWCLFFSLVGKATNNQSPNVIIIMTDDQGYGDFGFTGNPHIKTPFLDVFAKKSIRFNNFYVSPVCAPTRASLMTGRYSLRTGIRDTYNGGATMASNEVTIAELLKEKNYKTGIFGKWHLGDNYPFRPTDQGFDESLIHLAGGMGQVGDITNFFKGNTSYFDPVLWCNNAKKPYKGYCSDIFTDEAIAFIEKNKSKPFFCYLSFNAPHTPLQVPDKYYNTYKNIDPSTGFKDDNKPVVKMSEKDKEDARKVYGMVTNIDDNIGKLLQKLEDLKLAENTIVIFMTDNGPQQSRYIAGMRGLKSSVYQGGVRVPMLMSYPKLIKKDMDISTMTAHIDILPTVAELCDIELSKENNLDGKTLVPLINKKNVEWTKRPLFFYWTRRYPELYNNMAIQKNGLKLVGKTDYNAKIEEFELYDIVKDPYEQHNIILNHIPIAKNLKIEMDSIYKRLVKSKNLVNPPLPIIGSKFENPVLLNRNDADGQHGIWKQEEVYGKWNVSFKKGYYNLKFNFIKPVEKGGKIVLETNGIIYQKKVKNIESDIIKMDAIFIDDLDTELIPYYSIKRKKIFPFYIEIEKI